MKRLIILFLITCSLSAENIIISAGPKENLYINYSEPIVAELYKRAGFETIFNFSSFQGFLILEP
jgi:hypothetical protein